MNAHFIVCGLGTIGYRIMVLLHRLGERVVVVTQGGHEERLAAARDNGVEVLIGDARDPALLRRAGIDSARAVLVVASDDLANVEIALDARKLREDLPIVARLFDQSLARQLESAFSIRRALSMSVLAAPNFAAAAISREVVGSFAFEGSKLIVGRLAVADYPGLVGQRPDKLGDGKLRLLARGASGSMRRDTDSEVRAGETLVVLAKRDDFDALTGVVPAAARHAARGPWAGLKRVGANFAAAWRDASGGLKAVFTTLLALSAASVVVFHLGMGLSLVDAIYFTVTTLTTTGYGDITVKDQATWLKLYASTMMLLGSATVATVYSLITDWVVSSRVRQMLGRKPVPEDGHVVVAGLNTLGYRILEELRESGIEVVAIEKDGESSFVGGVQRQLPVVIGDPRMASVLEQARIASARAVVAVTEDDAANLSIGLTVRELNARARVVVRLFDAEFARKVEESPVFPIDAAMGASRIAAPTFVASALFPGALKAFIEGDTLCVLLDASADPFFEPADRPQVVWLKGAPSFEGDVSRKRGLVQVFRPFERTWETAGLVS